MFCGKRKTIPTAKAWSPLVSSRFWHRQKALVRRPQWGVIDLQCCAGMSSDSTLIFLNICLTERTNLPPSWSRTQSIYTTARFMQLLGQIQEKMSRGVSCRKVDVFACVYTCTINTLYINSQINNQPIFQCTAQVHM